MIGSIIFVILFASKTNTNTCPTPGVNVHVNQDTLVPRPSGEVLLTCAMSVLSDADMTSYHWRVDETQSLLYSYSITTGAGNIATNTHASLVVNENHFASAASIRSQLRLNLNMGSPRSFICELHNSKGATICSAKSHIEFKDPQVKVLFDRENAFYEGDGHSILVVNVTCDVDAVEGIPDMSLSYIGTKGAQVDLLDRGTSSIDRGSYFSSSYRELMRLPTSGHISCRVADGIGKYRATEPIATLSSACPDHMNVEVFQTPSRAHRPQDSLELKCKLTGITSSRVVYFWWKDRERDEPIYTFVVRDDEGRVAPAYSHALENKWHTSDEFGMTSIIKLRVNISTPVAFVCEFVSEDFDYCQGSQVIEFEDPHVTVTFLQNPEPGSEDQYRRSISEVICHVNASAGTPRFILEYSGDDDQKIEIIRDETRIRHRGEFSNWEHVAVVRLSSTGYVICRVTDSLGSYTEIRPIVAKGDLGASFVTRSTVLLSLMSLIIIPLTVIAVVCIVVRAKKKSKKQKSDILKSGRQEGFPSLKLYPNQRYHPNIGKFEWTRIAKISKYRRLFGDGGPSTEDVHQDVGSEADSWFLAAVYSLCIASHDWLQIFGNKKSLDESLTIKFWRFGKWEDVTIEPTLPTKNKHLCFLHSPNKHVFWTALLQKAYLSVYTPYTNWLDSQSSHVLEDLTGGVVLRWAAGEMKWDYMKTWLDKGFPMVCSKKVNGYHVFYSITDVVKERNIGYIQLHEFANDGGSAYRGFPKEKLSRHDNLGKDEFRITPTTFRKYFHVFRVLFFDHIYDPWNDCTLSSCGVFHDTWKHTHLCDDYHKDEFWENPQYLIEVKDEVLYKDNIEQDTSLTAGNGVNIWLAIMQKNLRIGFDRPLKMAYHLFQLSPDFTVTNRLKRLENGVTFWVLKSQFVPSREMDGRWFQPIGVRYIVVFNATTGSKETPDEFFLRFYTDRCDALVIRHLPPAPHEPCANEDETCPLMTQMSAGSTYPYTGHRLACDEIAQTVTYNVMEQ